MRIAVVGASGFVGAAVARAASVEGHAVTEVRPPRLSCAQRTASGVLRAALDEPAVEDLSDQLRGCGVVLNAAGVADAGAAADDHLYGANSLLPAVLDAAAGKADVARFVHVSSAAVQGHARRLTESAATCAFSPYSHSKALGEIVLSSSPRAVVYRPTSVHGPGRPVTKRLVTLAGSRWSSVAGSGQRPTPQVHIDGVASAAVFIATSSVAPPKYVLHPWEGFTTGGLLEALGGRPPRHLPSALVHMTLAAARVAGRASPRAAADARRLEMLWLGQPQDAGWLSHAGWVTPVERSHWTRLAALPGDG